MMMHLKKFTRAVHINRPLKSTLRFDLNTRAVPSYFLVSSRSYKHTALKDFTFNSWWYKTMDSECNLRIHKNPLVHENYICISVTVIYYLFSCPFFHRLVPIWSVTKTSNSTCSYITQAGPPRFLPCDMISGVSRCEIWQMSCSPSHDVSFPCGKTPESQRPSLPRASTSAGAKSSVYWRSNALCCN